ncbi:hypothetical protein K469DRAFT_689258 [Zopfia rhizophila CBS 207.26]|uniref:Uncharacterized protein n=1 Tax=Zopfia rhizophila CBS 207.26 TaxID=1314779 RepID=A0A6A6EU07_9PEZI|nr:hypothetical protein K469DRAFT_689258 [Zopfia rhizophila CBS 207.26]
MANPVASSEGAKDGTGEGSPRPPKTPTNNTDTELPPSGPTEGRSTHPPGSQTSGTHPNRSDEGLPKATKEAAPQEPNTPVGDADEELQSKLAPARKEGTDDERVWPTETPEPAQKKPKKKGPSSKEMDNIVPSGTYHNLRDLAPYFDMDSKALSKFIREDAKLIEIFDEFNESYLQGVRFKAEVHGTHRGREMQLSTVEMRLEAGQADGRQRFSNPSPDDLEQYKPEDYYARWLYRAREAFLLRNGGILFGRGLTDPAANSRLWQLLKRLEYNSSTARLAGTRRAKQMAGTAKTQTSQEGEDATAGNEGDEETRGLRGEKGTRGTHAKQTESSEIENESYYDWDQPTDDEQEAGDINQKGAGDQEPESEEASRPAALLAETELEKLREETTRDLDTAGGAASAVISNALAKTKQKRLKGYKMLYRLLRMSKTSIDAALEAGGDNIGQDVTEETAYENIIPQDVRDDYSTDNAKPETSKQKKTTADLLLSADILELKPSENRCTFKDKLNKILNNPAYQLKDLRSALKALKIRGVRYCRIHGQKLNKNMNWWQVTSAVRFQQL